MPYALQGSATSRAISPRPFLEGLFLIVCSVYLLGQRQKPSWCLHVSITCFIPASLAVLTHCRASSLEGLNKESSSFPSPHSLSVEVMMPKWKKAVISSCCQRHWRADGTVVPAVRMISASVSVGSIRESDCPKVVLCMQKRQAMARAKNRVLVSMIIGAL